MSRPQGGETITRGIMSSQNPRQSIIRRRKRELEPRQTIIWVRKCKRNSWHIILRGRKCKRNLRHVIIRGRKRERNSGQAITRVRKCEPNFGQAITRGWMRQTERGAGYHSVVTAIGARVNAQYNHLRNIPHKKHCNSSHFRTEYPRYLQESQLCRTFVIEYVIFLIVVRLIE